MILYFLTVLILIIASAESYAPRIVGGFVASIKRYPYVVSIEILGMHICGGSILNENFIITAAHCVEHRTPHTIKAGVSDIKQPGIVRKIRRAIMHPKYDTHVMEYDAAVLELSTPLTLMSGAVKLKPIKLPSPDARIPLAIGTVMGWGETQHDLEDTNVLRAVRLEIFTTEVCKSFRAVPLKPAMFCAGHVSGKRDSCTGDSGGPLVVDDVLYGLVSFGPKDCSSGIPGVYTNVPMIVDWLKETAKLDA